MSGEQNLGEEPPDANPLALSWLRRKTSSLSLMSFAASSMLTMTASGASRREPARRPCLAGVNCPCRALAIQAIAGRSPDPGTAPLPTAPTFHLLKPPKRGCEDHRSMLVPSNSSNKSATGHGIIEITKGESPRQIRVQRTYSRHYSAKYLSRCSIPLQWCEYLSIRDQNRAGWPREFPRQGPKIRLWCIGRKVQASRAGN